MKDNKDFLVYLVGVIIGALVGMWIMYWTEVAHKITLDHNDWACGFPEILESDPSKVVCTVFVKKGSYIYTEMNKLQE